MHCRHRLLFGAIALWLCAGSPAESVGLFDPPVKPDGRQTQRIFVSFLAKRIRWKRYSAIPPAYQGEFARWLARRSSATLGTFVERSVVGRRSKARVEQMKDIVAALKQDKRSDNLATLLLAEQKKAFVEGDQLLSDHLRSFRAQTRSAFLHVYPKAQYALSWKSRRASARRWLKQMSGPVLDFISELPALPDPRQEHHDVIEVVRQHSPQNAYAILENRRAHLDKSFDSDHRRLARDLDHYLKPYREAHVMPWLHQRWQSLLDRRQPPPYQLTRRVRNLTPSVDQRDVDARIKPRIDDYMRFALARVSPEILLEVKPATVQLIAGNSDSSHWEDQHWARVRLNINTFQWAARHEFGHLVEQSTDILALPTVAYALLLRMATIPVAQKRRQQLSDFGPMGLYALSLYNGGGTEVWSQFFDNLRHPQEAQRADDISFNAAADYVLRLEWALENLGGHALRHLELASGAQ